MSDVTRKPRSISKKLRFEVFKRDSFTCQYCGQKAPDVVLEIEHMHPVSKGGTSELLNLVTSCAGCNAGKGARTLDDSSVVERQRRQLEQLQSRREQIDMMLEWKTGLGDMNEYAIQKIGEYMSHRMPATTITRTGEKKLAQLIKKFGFDEVVESFDIAAAKCLVEGADGCHTDESIAEMWKLMERVANSRHASKTRPWLKDLYWCRSVARSRCSYFNDVEAIRLLEDVHSRGANVADMKSASRQCRNWTSWRIALEELVPAGHAESM
jgi:hypothetical protein